MKPKQTRYIHNKFIQENNKKRQQRNKQREEFITIFSEAREGEIKSKTYNDLM